MSTKRASTAPAGIGAVSTRRPFESVCRSKTGIAAHGIDGAVPGESDGRRRSRLSRTGCARCRSSSGCRRVHVCSSRAAARRSTRARAAGPAAHALDVVLGAAPAADVLVAISHEGETTLTLEAVRGFCGRDLGDHGQGGHADPGGVRHVVVAHAGGRAELLPHGELRLRGRGRPRALRGEDVSWLARRGRGEARRGPLPVSGTRALARRRRGPRLADGTGGGAEAARGCARGRRGAPDRAAAARPPRGDRRERPLLRSRGRGPRCGTGRSRRARARRDRLRRHARSDSRTLSSTSSPSSVSRSISPPPAGSTRT